MTGTVTPPIANPAEVSASTAQTSVALCGVVGRMALSRRGRFGRTAGLTTPGCACPYRPATQPRSLLTRSVTPSWLGRASNRCGRTPGCRAAPLKRRRRTRTSEAVMGALVQPPTAPWPLRRHPLVGIPCGSPASGQNLGSHRAHFRRPSGSADLRGACVSGDGSLQGRCEPPWRRAGSCDVLRRSPGAPS